MDDPVLQAGAALALAYFVIKELFLLVRSLIGKRVGAEKKINDEILELTRRLYEMHDQKDLDGVYVWYFKQSLVKALEDLAEAIAKLHRELDS